MRFSIRDGSATEETSDVRSESDEGTMFVISEYSRALLKAIFVLVGLFAVPFSHATGTAWRAYLSSKGSDSNPCSLQQPCRLLPAALAAVQDGGDIWILDSANYNTAPVSISQNVTILAIPGVTGSLIATNGNAINITGSAISVTLRNLSIRNLSGASNSGVYFTAGGSLLVVENSQFNGLSNGVQVAASSSTSKIFHSSFIGNDYAINLNKGDGLSPTVYVDRCIISSAGIHGIEVFSAYAVVSHNTITSAGPNAAGTDRYGIFAGDGGWVMLDDNAISQFQWGIVLSGSGIVKSTSSNTLFKNLSDISDPNGNYSKINYL